MNNNNVLEEMIRFQTDRGLDKKNFDVKNCIINILSEIYEMFGYKGEVGEGLAKELYAKEFEGMICVKDDDLVDALFDISEFSIGDMLKLGYNPIIACQEGCKEINSRVGKIIDGKFQKDKTPKAQANWYTADYSKARIKPYENSGYIPEYFKR